MKAEIATHNCAFVEGLRWGKEGLDVPGMALTGGRLKSGARGSLVAAQACRTKARTKASSHSGSK